MARAAASALAAAAGSSSGAPNSARKPSPRNLLMKPLLRSTISIISAKKSFSSATVSSADRVRVMAVKPRMSRNSTQTVRLLAPQLGVEQLLDHDRRHVLAEQVGHPVARRRGGDRILELLAQRCRATIAAATPASISMTLRLK